MKLQDVRELLGNTLTQIDNVIGKGDPIKVEQELHTAREISVMFKISQQQVWRLFKQYNIKIINLACPDSKRPSLRVSKVEVARFRELLNM